jgi:hypothetical protein
MPFTMQRLAFTRIIAVLVSCLATRTQGFTLEKHVHNEPSTRRAYSSTKRKALPATIEDLFTGLQATTSSLHLPTIEVDQWLSTISTGVIRDSSHYSDISSALTDLAITTPTWHYAVIGALLLSVAVKAWVFSPIDFSKAPFEPGTNTYSPEASKEFYAKRPLMVAKRILKLGLLSGTFNIGVLFDWLVLGKLFKDDGYTALKNAEPRRAKESLVLCEELGPTFIKLGQALSIRTDLIPAAYALELRQLQDAVSPFDSQQAYDILRQEFGEADLGQIFSTLSEKPIASASIGQVYKGILARDRKEVAVKVQRPGILSEIALDLRK